MTSPKRPPPEILRRIRSLNAKQRAAYYLWRRLFGIEFSLWAAENNVWHPDQGGEVSKEVDLILRKRKARLKFFAEPGVSRAETIRDLDRFTMSMIAMAKARGSEVENFNIFYEIET